MANNTTRLPSTVEEALNTPDSFRTDYLYEQYPGQRSEIDKYLNDGVPEYDIVNKLNNTIRVNEKNYIENAWNTSAKIKLYKDQEKKKGNNIVGWDDPTNPYDIVSAIKAGALPELDQDTGEYKWPEEYIIWNHPNNTEEKIVEIDGKRFNRQTQRYEQDFWDVFSTAKASDFIPFVNSVVDAQDIRKVFDASRALMTDQEELKVEIERLEEEKQKFKFDKIKSRKINKELSQLKPLLYNSEYDAILKEYVQRGQMDYTFGGKVAAILKELPAFGGELLFTGGAYTFGKKATMEGIQKMVGDLAQKNIGTQLLAKSTAGIVGGIVQTPLAGATRIVEDTIQRMLPEFRIEPGSQDEADLREMVLSGEIKEGDDILTAFPKAFVNQGIEVISERSGGLVGEMKNIVAKGMLKQNFKLGFVKAMLKKNPTLTTSKLKKILKQSGYNGVVSEVFEERIGDVGRTVLLGEDFNLPTGEELLAELVAFSVPGAAGAISQGTVSPVKKGDSEVQKKLDIAKDEGSIDDATYTQASYIASLDPNIDENIAIDIVNETKLVTEELIQDTRGQTKEDFLKDEGLDPEGEAVITGSTQVDQETGRTVISLYNGSDATTIVEEFYHDTYNRLPENEKESFGNYHEETNDARSVEEHFAQEGTDYYFNNNMSENAYGGLRGVFNKLKNAFHKIVGRTQNIDGAKIPEQIENIYKGAFQERGATTEGTTDFQAVEVTSPTRSEQLSTPILPEGPFEKDLIKKFNAAEKIGRTPTARQLKMAKGSPGKYKENLVEEYDVYVKRIRETLENSPNVANWYFEYGKGAREIVGKENMREFSIMFGITSAQKSTDDNLRDALHVMAVARKIDPVKNPKEFKEAVKKLPSGSGMLITNAQLDKMIESYKSGNFSGGQKISNYMLTTQLASENQFNPFTVNDVHMGRFFGFLRKDASGNPVGLGTGNHRYIQYLTSRIAKELGISTQAAQAAAWAWARDNRGKPGEKTGLYDEALAHSIKEGVVDEFNQTNKQPYKTFQKENLDPLGFTGNLAFTSEVIKNIDEQAPKIIASVTPGKERGFLKTLLNLKDSREYEKAVFDEILDEDGNLKFLVEANIPHKIERTIGSYGDLEASFLITLPQATYKDATEIATILGDAGLQDSIIPYQNIYTKGLLSKKKDIEGGVSVTKADGSKWTLEEIEDFHKTINPNKDQEGVNFYQHDENTLRVIAFEGMEQQVANALQKYTQSSKFGVEGFTTQTELIQNENYNRRIREIIRGQRQDGGARQSDLQRIAQDSLYRPIQKVFQKYKDRFQPGQTQQKVTQYQAKPLLGESGRRHLTGHRTKKSFRQWSRDTLVPVSGRLRQIAPKLLPRLRRLDYNIFTKIKRDIDAATPFIESFQQLFKRNPELAIELEIALKNGSLKDQKRINQIFKENQDLQLGKNYRPVKKLLNRIFKDAQQARLDIGEISRYFPRLVQDHEGFIQYMELNEENYLEKGFIQEEISLTEKKIGRALPIEKKAELINARLRGFGKKIKSGVASTKRRKITKITPEMNEYYHSLPHTLTTYISSMHKEIEQNRFFKKPKRIKGEPKLSDTSIGQFIVDAIEKNQLNPRDQDELRLILDARFNPGGESVGVSFVKGLSYLQTMGNFGSAITQLGDLAWAQYTGGLGSAGSILTAAKGKAKITKQDLGIDKISQEMSDSKGIHTLVNKTFEVVGISKIDTFGKNALIQATYDKLQRQAKKGKFDKKSQRLLNDAFANEPGAIEQIVQDLKDGQVTEDIKYLMFFQLGNFQPISESEMPVNYLANSGVIKSRLMYQLKTFTIKQFDAFRTEASNLMREGYRTGNVKQFREGFRNMMELAAVFMLANATSDVLKNILFGRKIHLDDLLLDNLFRLFGVSKFITYQVKREGFDQALYKIFTPVVIGTGFTIQKDLEKTLGYPVNKFLYKYRNAEDDREKEKLQQNMWEIIRDWQSWKYVPLIGKLWYWHIGHGANRKYKEEVADLRKIASKRGYFTDEDRKEYEKYILKLKARNIFSDEKFARYYNYKN